MGGERLDKAVVGPLGIEGDRCVHVRDAGGRIVTARMHPGLLGHRSTLGASSLPLVDGRPWAESSVERDILDIVGPGAELVYDASSERFDVLPLLIATDGAIQAFAEDRRRLRPNLVIAGVDGLQERSWPGSFLRIGPVRIRVQSLRDRCVMTTFHPDTLVQDLRILERIVSEFGGKLALNATVIEGGCIRVGDDVQLTR